MTAARIVGAVLAGGTVLASALLLGLGRAARALREALGQAYGYIRWCLPGGHLWTGRSDEHPDWLGVCVTCGKVAPPRPSWRRFILMGDCVPNDTTRSSR